MAILKTNYKFPVNCKQAFRFGLQTDAMTEHLSLYHKWLYCTETAPFTSNTLVTFR